MQVIDRLTPFIAYVECQPIAGIGDLELLRKLICRNNQSGQKRPFRRIKLPGPGNMLPRDNQDVNRRPRVNVVNREDVVIVAKLVAPSPR